MTRIDGPLTSGMMDTVGRAVSERSRVWIATPTRVAGTERKSVPDHVEREDVLLVRAARAE